MHDRSIAWMMSGGNRYETAEDRLDHLHARALHDARAAATVTTPARSLASFSLRTRAAAALAVIGIGSTTPDCCVA